MKNDPEYLAYRLRHFFRALTPLGRVMPDFIILGAQRGGTTSLFNYLNRHPCVDAAIAKEIHFFDIYFTKGLRWYECHFPSRIRKRYVERVERRVFCTGEASPYYLFHPHAPARVSRIVPCAKLIVLLRNPVERAYSHYRMQVRNGIEGLSFKEALEAEPRRLAGEREKMTADENYTGFNHRSYSYLARGIYVDQLQAWRRFFPKEQFLILKSEDLSQSPPVVMSRVYEFLGLPNRPLREHTSYHVTHYAEKMDPSIRESLVRYFKPHNERLYRYLGMDLGWNP